MGAKGFNTFLVLVWWISLRHMGSRNPLTWKPNTEKSFWKFSNDLFLYSVFIRYVLNRHSTVITPETLSQKRRRQLIHPPGPLAPPDRILPSLNITALSYSCTTCSTQNSDYSYRYKKYDCIQTTGYAVWSGSWNYLVHWNNKWCSISKITEMLNNTRQGTHYNRAVNNIQIIYAIIDRMCLGFPN